MRPICSSPVSVLQSQLLEITAKSLPHGLNENFTMSPTIHDEVTLFGLKPTEGKRRRWCGGVEGSKAEREGERFEG